MSGSIETIPTQPSVRSPKCTLPSRPPVMPPSRPMYWREDARGRDAADEVRGEVAVQDAEPVVAVHRPGGAGRDGLLAEAVVERAGDLALAVEHHRALLDAAHEQHRAQQPDAVLEGQVLGSRRPVRSAGSVSVAIWRVSPSRCRGASGIAAAPSRRPRRDLRARSPALAQGYRPLRPRHGHPSEDVGCAAGRAPLARAPALAPARRLAVAGVRRADARRRGRCCTLLPAYGAAAGLVPALLLAGFATYRWSRSPRRWRARCCAGGGRTCRGRRRRLRGRRCARSAAIAAWRAVPRRRTRAPRRRRVTVRRARRRRPPSAQRCAATTVRSQAPPSSPRDVAARDTWMQAARRRLPHVRAGPATRGARSALDRRPPTSRRRA